MNLQGKVVVVTGGGGGLGGALCRAFAGRGARVAAADISLAAAEAVARTVGGLALRADVSQEAEIQRLAADVEIRLGPIDLFFSNAGGGGGRDAFAPDAVWQSAWQLNVMSSIYAVRALLPSMLARGGGYFASTASAVALTSQPHSSPYVVTKHANLAFYETLALDYWDQGIRVSCVCPLGMRTNMLERGGDANAAFGDSTAIDADLAAARILEGIEAERFLILTHPEVHTYFQRKAADHDRWLSGMRRLYARPSSETLKP